jgi:FeS assembly SUF system regulator
VIRLSRLSDYGIVLMALLAGRAGRADAGPYNAREVAAEAHLPLPVVSKILKGLARRGLLVSHRGAKGGYSLAREPERVTVADILQALEGPLALMECSAGPGHCGQESSCGVREPWQRINRSVLSALQAMTLAELAGPRAPLLGIEARHAPATAVRS